jgi:hypothetical protein
VDDISPYIEAADQPTLRRTLRTVLDHLDTLNQIAAASTAIAQSAKDHAHHTHAAAQAATAPGTGPESHALPATAADTYFSYLGFVCGAYHISYCVNGITAAIASGLGLTGWPPDDHEHGEPGANQRPPASDGPGT